MFTCALMLNVTHQAFTHLYYKAKQHFIDHTKPIISSFFTPSNTACIQHTETNQSLFPYKKVEAVRREIC